MLPEDVEVLSEAKDIAEDLVAAPVLNTDIKVQMDLRTPAQPRALTPEAGPSAHATEKMRPAKH